MKKQARNFLLFYFLGFLFFVCQKALFFHLAVMVEGRVVSTVWNASASPEAPEVRAQIETTISGQVVRFWVSGMRADGLLNGDTVVIGYDPAKPEHRLIDNKTERWLIPAFWMGELVGGLFSRFKN